MRPIRTISFTIGFAVAFTSIVIAEAATFSDVPSTYVYANAITALADKGVINGNPDGTFAPSRSVNRAEFLTMLYRVSHLTPDAPAQSCFKDVPASAWFTGVVCDAAAKGRKAQIQILNV